jgi:hypothetical protein
MVNKQLFLDNKVAEAAVGRITGDELGHLELATATPEALDDSVELFFFLV